MRGTLQRYRDFAPTPLDPAGAFLNDRDEWLVVPVGRNRDSQPFDESNFEAALARLGGESETVEVHRFGHWGPGWFEILIVDPSREAEVAEIAAALESYPVLDDDDLSTREHEAAEESWDNWGRSEWRRELERRFPDVPGVDELDDAALDALANGDDSGRVPEYETHDDGPYFNCLGRAYADGTPAVVVTLAELLPHLRGLSIEDAERLAAEAAADGPAPIVDAPGQQRMF